MRPVGHIRDLGGGRWRVEVERGFRTDGSRRRSCRTVEGTYAQAQIVAAQMASEMGRSDAWGDSVTLHDWYWHAFRDRPSVRGTRRSENTLGTYDSAFRCHVDPTLGPLPVSSITHEMMAACVRSSSSPHATKVVLRAVMRAAYDEGLVPDMPMQRRIPARVEHRTPEEPWSRFEAMAALSADWPDPSLAAFLVLGLSGLRKEEALGARPCDVSEGTTYSYATGAEVETMTVTVMWTYTDRGGWREATKNEWSARTVPILVPGRDLLRDSLRSLRTSALSSCHTEEERASAAVSWAEGRIVGGRADAFCCRWDTALRRLGLRRITPKMLRHTSTTLMDAAGVSSDLSDKMHGRADHGVTYRNYYRPDAALMEAAAARVGAILDPLPGPPRA